MEWHFVLLLTVVASITLLAVVATWCVFKKSASKIKQEYNRLGG